MLVIGLTGGIGVGKTCASNCFSNLGVPVIDADVIARSVVSNDRALVDALAARFGVHVLDEHGALDRKKLANIVFSDLEMKKELERIVHPAVLDELCLRLRQLDVPYCVLSIPLLIETPEMISWVDRVLVIDANESLQIQRTMERDQVNREFVQMMMQAQTDRESRLMQADEIIFNNQTVAVLWQKIQVVHDHYRFLARRFL